VLRTQEIRPKKSHFAVNLSDPEINIIYDIKTILELGHISRTLVICTYFEYSRPTKTEEFLRDSWKEQRGSRPRYFEAEVVIVPLSGRNPIRDLDSARFPSTAFEVLQLQSEELRSLIRHQFGKS
jgi:hypothetical protein